MSHSRLVIGRSSLHGRGLFAVTDLAAATVVEVSPIVLVGREEGDRDGVVGRYLFEWDVDEDATAYALALGWGSLFNHSGEPSCRYVRADDAAAIADLAPPANGSPAGAEAGTAPALVFVTTRAVAAGEELTIDYSGNGDHDFPFPPEV